jgi:excisionase family DNA binding protein
MTEIKMSGELLTISVPEAARRLGLSAQGLYTLARRGEFPSIRLGSRVLIPLRAIERMLDEAGQRQRETAA